MKLFPALLLSFSLITGVLSCQPQKPKVCPPVQARAILSETEEVRQYLKGAGIAAKEDSMGFFYVVEQEGMGKKPTACSDVTVDYEGFLTDGKPFDAGKDVSFNLSQLIVGWKMGIPKIQAGGKITLYLPPSLAYGEEETEGIPAHSILVFKIGLKEVE